MIIETATEDHAQSRSSTDKPALQFVTFEVAPAAGGGFRLSSASTYLDEINLEFLSENVEVIGVATVDEVVAAIREAMTRACASCTERSSQVSGQQPAYRAYTVIKRENQDDFWMQIGAAFAHQSGDGYNIVLQALPLPGPDGQVKIVLRPPKTGDEETKEAVREANDRRRTR